MPIILESAARSCTTRYRHDETLTLVCIGKLLRAAAFGIKVNYVLSAEMTLF